MTTPLRQPFFRALTPSVHGGVDAGELARCGLTPEAVIDFSANQSPLGPAPHVVAAVASAVLDAYPDRDAHPLALAIATRHGVSADQVVTGNGSTELIRLIAQLALMPGTAVLAVTPTFGEYRVATELAGAHWVEFPLTAEEGFALDIQRLYTALRATRPVLCWWCAPNNPTGTAAVPEAVAAVIKAHPETLFVLDEAYCDLLPAPQWTPALLEAGNLIVLRSMTKAWGLAGVRLGYALGTAGLMGALRGAKPPWNVNACAQAAGIAALVDTTQYTQTLALLLAERQHLVKALKEQGWPVVSSAAAFFLIDVGDAAAIKRRLLAHGCLVRDCTSFGLPAYVRVSPRRPEQNARLLEAFAAVRCAG